MRNCFRGAAAVVVLTVVVPLSGLVAGAACAAEPGGTGISFATGVDYTRGTYGTSNTTTITSVPFTVVYDADRFSLDATLPYLRVNGPTGQTIVGGRVIPTSQQLTLAQRALATPQIGTVTGWGDLVVGGTYYIEGTGVESPTYSLRAQVKFGTANSNNGLGTGKNDFTLQGGVSKPFGSWLLSGNLGYTKVGSPAGISLKNTWFASLDGGYRIGEKSRLGLNGYASQRIADGTSSPVEATLYYSYDALKSLQLRGYLLKGLSNGSADTGIGFSVFYLF